MTKQEIIGKRTRNSKTFEEDDGSRTLQLRRCGLHYLKDGKYEDIDITIVNGAMNKAGYNFKVEGNKITFTKDGDWIEFEVDKLQWSSDQGQSIVSLFDDSVIPVVTGNEVRWDNAFGPGIHLLYGCSPDGIYKKVIIDDYIEPPAHMIDIEDLILEVVIKYRKSNIQIKVDGSNESFNIDRYLRKERVVFGDNKFEFRAPIYWDSGVAGSGVGHRIISKNRIRTGVMHSWLVKAIYPVFLDTDVNEQVGASTDDGFQNSGGATNLPDTIIQLGCSGPYSSDGVGGFRFTTVAVPKDANIISAVISLNSPSWAGTYDAHIAGVDEDNTGTWTEGSGPSNRTPTTATVSCDRSEWSDPVENWITSPDISTIIAEITSREGWVSDNALGIILENDATVSGNSLSVRAWDYSGNIYGAKLDINYTAAAGWSGKICGVTNPAKVCGVLNANIAKVSGV